MINLFVRSHSRRPSLTVLMALFLFVMYDVAILMPGLVSPCANVPPKHYYAGAPSLHPGLSAARGDTDGLKAIQPSQSIFFSSSIPE